MELALAFTGDLNHLWCSVYNEGNEKFLWPGLGENICEVRSAQHPCFIYLNLPVFYIFYFRRVQGLNRDLWKKRNYQARSSG